MKHLLSITSLAGIFAVTGHQAEWTMVSTFDDASALDQVTDVTNIPDSGARSEVVDGQWAVYPGQLWEDTSNLFALLDLGTDLNQDGTVTVYFEFTQPMIDGEKAILDTVWGLSNVGPTDVIESGFNSYNAMQRIASGSGAFEGRNGDSYEEIAQLEGGVKYAVWLVIDYDLGYYQSYIQGGQWEEPTMVESSTEGIWTFRENPGDAPMQYFLIALSAGNTDEPKGRDPAYFDNIAYDLTGENLAVPEAADGPGGGNGGDPVFGPGILDEFEMEDNMVDTGAWMGHVYAEYYPWVYSYGLGTYIWLDEGDGEAAAGTWFYAPRLAGE